MKKILGLSIIALVLIGIIAGGTFAYFSDTETSAGNTFTAGKLNLVNVISGMAVNSSITITEQGDGLNDNVVFGADSANRIKPGSSGNITWTLTNNGSLAGTLTMVALATFSEGGAPNEPEAAAEGGTPVGLGTKLVVWVTRNGTDILGSSGAYVAMSGLDAVLNAESQSLAGGGSLVYILHWQIPISVGNEIQGDTATLGITFTLNQTP
jgi:spore coat-associated protein N